MSSAALTTPDNIVPMTASVQTGIRVTHEIVGEIIYVKWLHIASACESDVTNKGLDAIRRVNGREIKDASELLWNSRREKKPIVVKEKGKKSLDMRQCGPSFMVRVERALVGDYDCGWC